MKIDLFTLQNNVGTNFGRLPFHDIIIDSDYPSLVVIVFLFEEMKFSMQESLLQSLKSSIQK